jgi:putative membrane protein
MKLRKTIRTLVVSATALYCTTLIIPGFTINKGVKNIILASLVLFALNLLARPLIKLLLLPINLLTLGAFRWLTSVVLLYLLITILPEVNINPFNLHQLPLIGNLLPAWHLTRFLTVLLTSITLGLVQSIFFWLLK